MSYRDFLYCENMIQILRAYTYSPKEIHLHEHLSNFVKKNK